MSQNAGFSPSNFPGGFVQTLTGDIGGPVPPTGGNINVITAHSTNSAGATFLVSGNAGTSTLTWTVTDAFNNTFFGLHSGNLTYTNAAIQNTGLGASTLSGITTGLSNIAVGYLALTTLTSGSANIGIGQAAGNLLTSGNHNVLIGLDAGEFLLTGADNTIIGDSSGTAYTGAESGNIILGANITGVLGESNVTRVGNIYGTTVGATNAVVVVDNTGKLGTAPGGGSPIETITGNTGGPESPSAGNFNFLTANSTVIFAGSAATETLDFGLTNLLLGSSGSAIAGAVRNVGVGFSALNAITSGSSNVGVGYQAGQAITTGGANIALGYHSLTTTTTGSDNVCIGTSAISLAGANPNACIAIGSAALGIFTGSGGTDGNVGVGNSALGHIATGTFNIGLGYNSGNSLTLNDHSNICINHPGVVADTNTLRIGAATGSGSQQLAKAFICGIDGVNVGSTATVVTEASNQLGTAVITAGSNISVTPGANTITIAALGGGAVTWSVISANQTAAVNNGYFCNKAGTLALALPATSAVGDVIEVANENTATGIQFTQAAGQQILLPNNTSTTLGATGTLTSSAIGDSMKLVCKTANTIWRCVSMNGNWTPV